MLLFSAGELEIASNGVYTFEHISWLVPGGISYVFGLLWWAGFMNAMAYMIVAGTIFLSSFANKKWWSGLTQLGTQDEEDSDKDVPHSSMTAAFCIATRYHMGT